MIKPSAEITYTTQTFDLNEATTDQSFDFSVSFENIEEDAGKCYLMINESGGMSSIYQAEIDELDEGENNIHVSYSDIFENYTPTSGSEYSVEIVAYVEQGKNLDSAYGSLEIVDTTPVTPTIEFTADAYQIMNPSDAQQQYVIFETDITDYNENVKVEATITKNSGQTTIIVKDDFTLQEGNNFINWDLSSVCNIQQPVANDIWNVELKGYNGDTAIATGSFEIDFVQ